jgi:hypothetical protein
MRSPLWILVVAVLCVAGPATAGFLSPNRDDSPYRGVVVDDATGEPISGAVVLAIWEREREEFLRTVNVFYDARETITDSEGKWTIPAQDIERRAPDKTWIPLFVAYTPGYFPWGPGSDRATRITGTAFSTGVTMRLRRALTQTERLQAVRRVPPRIPDEKMPQLIQLMNQEEIGLGLQPTHGQEGR